MIARAEGWQTAEVRGDCARLIALFEGRAEVQVVDATRGAGPPGTVSMIEAHAVPLPAGRFFGASHLLGVAEAVETARALGMLPARLILWGVEGARFGAGEGLSAEAERGAREVLARLGRPRGRP